MVSFHGILAESPVIDVDGTLWIQGGLFVALFLILNPLLFQPWLKTQERRRVAIEGAAGDAGDLGARARELQERYDLGLAQARAESLESRNRSRREEERRQAARLAEVRMQANAELERTRGQLATAAAAARQTLTGRIDELAQQIVDKLMRRPS